MKTLFRWLGRLLTGLLLLLVVYFTAALILSAWPAGAGDETCDNHQPVYVTTNGVHVFLVVPRHYFSTDFLRALRAPADARYLYLGWGEKNFYRQTPTWNDLTLSVALQAAMWPSDAAMHVIYFRQKRARWRKVDLCPTQKQALLRYVQQSFRKQGEYFQRLPAKGYSEEDYFYPATGSYSLFYTCNTWANEALKLSGQEAALWTPFDFGVLWHVPGKE